MTNANPGAGAIDRLSIGGAIVAAAAFIGLVGSAATRFMGVDDAFYLGIGANILNGRGPVTAFGYFASQHAPLWPIMIAAPGVWFGLDTPGWAHVLVVIGGVGVILLAAWFAWRAVRLAAVVAAAAMLGFPFMIRLADGMGLDLPAAALALAYLAIGLVAVRRGSIGFGVVAGLVFAGAFLTKEIALPFAPVPLLAALVRGAPIRGVVRATAATLLASMVATSWWFIVFAQETGTVYRIGTPWWTLIPIAVAGFGAAILGLVGGRWLPPPGDPGTDAGRRRWRLVGWLGAAIWALLLTAMFARTPTGLGSGFLVPSQVASNVAKWFPSVGSVLAVGLIGGAYEVAHRLRRSRATTDNAGSDVSVLAPSDPAAIDDLLIATICGFPLILLVISVGEGPRHYIAQLAVLVAIGACGWVRIAERISRRDRAATLLAIVAVAAVLALALPTLGHLVSRRLVLRLVVVGGAILAVAVAGSRIPALRGRATRRGGVVAVALSTLIGAAVVVTSVVVPLHRPSIDQTRELAVRTIVGWIRTNLPAGSSIVLANQLAFELALPLQTDYRTWDLRDKPGLKIRPAAPLGVGTTTESDADDWVALRASPGDVTSLAGYRSSTILDRLRAIGPSIWIQSELTGVSQPSPIVAALAAARGVTVAETWDWRYGAGRLQTTVFRIDPTHLEFGGRLVVTTKALQRIVSGLEAAGTLSRAAAEALAARIDVANDDPAATPLLDRLRQLTGR